MGREVNVLFRSSGGPSGLSVDCLSHDCEGALPFVRFGYGTALVRDCYLPDKGPDSYFLQHEGLKV